MKSIRYISIALAVSLMVTACAKEAFEENIQEQEEQTETPSYNKVHMTFSLGKEESELKSLFTDNAILWESGDEIAVYDGADLCEFYASNISKDGMGADFEGEAAEVDNYVIVAPYSTATKVNESSISVKLNQTQTVDASHKLDSEAMISTGIVSKDGHVRLTNQFALVKVSITRNDVVSVKLKGNNNESIGGTNHLGLDGTMDLSNAGGKSITLRYADNDGVFEQGDYYIATWPVTFTNGFKLIMTTTDGSKAAKSKSTETVLVRNGGSNLSTIDNVTTWCPTTITTAKQLKMWRRVCEDYGNSDVIKLGADIDLSEGGAVFNWETPSEFDGQFDGQNHKITKFVVDKPATRTGFIGTLGEKASFSNVTFGASGDGSSITLTQSDPDSWCYVGIIGYVHNNSSVTNVTTYVPVCVDESCDGKHGAGGICGIMKKNTTVENCTNYAPVTDNSSYNSTSADSCLGGIAGMSDSAGSIIKNCIHSGDDKSPVTNYCTGTPHIGGIVGRISGSGTVEGCTNDAYIFDEVGSPYDDTSFKVFLGGIAGVVTNSNAKIIKCTNEERARANASLSIRLGIGGIVGGATGSGLQILGCVNNAGTLNVEFSNSRDIAIGGIIGYSSNTIRISKAEDGTWTENKKGYTQDKNFNCTAYIGGIAGMLDKESTDNIVEYCKTAASARFEFNAKQTSNNIAANVGGICGATKGVITNCTNNMHIYCRKESNSKGYPRINYGGICGGYSENRYPKEISYCTNNGNVGAYAAVRGDPTFGGIICALYPEKTVVKFCTNRGAMTTGQAKTNGTIAYIQNHGGFSMGALCGEVAQTTGSTPVTILEGCVVDSRAIANQVSNYDFMGLVCGWLAGKESETGHPTVYFGSAQNPLIITTTSAVKIGTSTDDPTVETAIATATDYESIKDYLFPPYLFYRTDKAINFPGGIDSDAFKARYDWHILFGSELDATTE